jgi:regulator of protease activity HflC (stomatin/prohibitin superfamily)
VTMVFGKTTESVGNVVGSVVKKALLIPLLFFVLVLLWSLVGVIETGNVGVRTTLGHVSQDEVTPGMYLAFPGISRVEQFSAKEIAIELNDMTPKAKDNLSLRDMDVTAYYRVVPGKIAEIITKYASQSARMENEDFWVPAYNLVFSVSRNIIYEEVARIDSLVVHTRRDDIGAEIKKNLQLELDKNDPGVFQVSRVILRSITTDPAIEESIRLAVSNQKKLEAMKVQVDIAQKEAEVKITEAKGIAESNHIINQSLTREYLQHEANLALLKFAEKGNTNTVVVPANMSVAPLISIPAAGAGK